MEASGGRSAKPTSLGARSRTASASAPPRKGVKRLSGGGSTYGDTCYFLRDIDRPQNCDIAPPSVVSFVRANANAPQHAPPRTAPQKSSSAAAQGCATTDNMDNSAPNIGGRQAASSPEECCAQCDADPSCTVGVFYENFCYLKAPADPT